MISDAKSEYTNNEIDCVQTCGLPFACPVEYQKKGQAELNSPLQKA